MEKGNTIVVIEHNLDVIKSADYLIDIGPGGGDAGGDVVAVGTPEKVALVQKSYTGQFLKGMLGGDDLVIYSPLLKWDLLLADLFL